MIKNIRINCKNIKIVLTDVDGVLTNGGMYYSKEGDIMKKFHVRDGMGVNMLLRNKILTIIITKEKNQIVKQWAKNMNVEKLYQGIQKKEELIEEICKNYKVSSKELAFIGDDINDKKLLQKVGFSAAPNDCVPEIKKICDYICKKNGGEGVFREISDLIIKTQNLDYR